MEKRVSEPKSENPINEFRPAEGEVIPAFSIPLLRGKISHLDQESMVNDCREWVGESKVDMEMMWVKIIQPTLTMTSEIKSLILNGVMNLQMS